MKIEVLLSCMNQKDFSITEKMNLTTDILIVNQCNRDKYEERIVNGKKQRMISTVQRGLSKSRNELLLNMNNDIGLICDDDVIYERDYEKKVLKAFSEFKDADIIIFNITSIGRKVREIKKRGKVSKYRNYSSVRIAFKKESLYKKNIWFNINFGTGSIYSMGEEALLLAEAKRKGLKIYQTTENILTVDSTESSWFKGYNEKLFYDKGAWLKEAYPYACFIFKWYFILKFGEKKIKKMYEINRLIKRGILGYTRGLGYNEVEN